MDQCCALHPRLSGLIGLHRARKYFDSPEIRPSISVELVHAVSEDINTQLCLTDDCLITQRPQILPRLGNGHGFYPSMLLVVVHLGVACTSIRTAESTPVAQTVGRLERTADCLLSLIANCIVLYSYVAYRVRWPLKDTCRYSYRTRRYHNYFSSNDSALPPSAQSWRYPQDSSRSTTKRNATGGNI